MDGDKKEQTYTLTGWITCTYCSKQTYFEVTGLKLEPDGFPSDRYASFGVIEEIREELRTHQDGEEAKE